ncbi:aminoglycoside N(3)-acetyltransferase [Paenibacillus glufosinatiresistens]|uniref:aminoglycoside N(3)-acetyltransferase n=1 Tax=Paenibacillus glufosinatiresistens TaxID=3070657 RepID=UPI00286E0B28|nr:AAC(3) family N-acetyltransferase [Paenibacillus sp. YX.27]
MTDYASGQPILTLPDLIREFRACGLAEGQTVIAHASLSRLGFVVGGAETLIRALLTVLGPEGTLMIPSQTWKNLDPDTGVHGDLPAAWRPIIREHWPAYDPALTPAIGMGQAAEMLRTWPGAARSDHPARSFAAVGPKARHLTGGHDLRNIFGSGSPLDKLYQLGGHVLLIGVGHDKNTSLHLAETRAAYPSKRLVEESSAIMENGVRRWVTYPTLEVNDSDFTELGEAYEREQGPPIHRIGGAEVRFFEQRPFVDWAAAWMEEHRR